MRGARTRFQYEIDFDNAKVSADGGFHQLYDLVVRNGVVVDGTGLPRRRADVAIRDGSVVAVGRVDESGSREIDADGLHVIPGIVDAHTHYDPLLTFDPWATSSCFHGVTTVVTANCGFSVAPCAPGDHAFTEQFMAAVEGFSPSVLEAGLPWTWESFPSYLDALEGRLGVNSATYVAHSALRRFVMGERASTETATQDDLAAMTALIRSARAAGACGFSTERMGAELDHLGNPTPSVIADEVELEALIWAAGASPTGSVAVLPRSVGEGLTPEDARLLERYAAAARLPVVIQGIGWRPGLDAQWEADQAFLDDASRAGHAIYSIYRNHPMVRPFDWLRGTSLFKGVYHWRDFPQMSAAEVLERVSAPEWRPRLVEALDHPITDPALGATTPPPPMDTVFVERTSRAGAEGASIADLAHAHNQHAAEVICDLLAADSLSTGFAWRTETDAWRRGTAETLRHPNILVGTGDGGAHADRDDGSEWSTYFLSSWVRDEELFTLEEGVRRITSVPARVCGLDDRGVIAPGFGADFVLLDLGALGLGTKSIVNDLPAGGERWRAEVDGIEQVIVNGEAIVESNKITGNLPGAVLRTRTATN